MTLETSKFKTLYRSYLSIFDIEILDAAMHVLSSSDLIV